MHSEPGPVVGTKCHTLGHKVSEGEWNKQKQAGQASALQNLWI